MSRPVDEGSGAKKVKSLRMVGIEPKMILKRWSRTSMAAATLR